MQVTNTTSNLVANAIDHNYINNGKFDELINKHGKMLRLDAVWE